MGILMMEGSLNIYVNLLIMTAIIRCAESIVNLLKIDSFAPTIDREKVDEEHDLLAIFTFDIDRVKQC